MRRGLLAGSVALLALAGIVSGGAAQSGERDGGDRPESRGGLDFVDYDLHGPLLFVILSF